MINLEDIKLNIIQELENLKIGHYYCDDSWYSCPLSSEGCADDSIPQDECNCGASEYNERIDKIIKYLLKDHGLNL